MSHEYASQVLNSYPPPRIRVVLKNGEVLETPRSLMASASERRCILSTDGQSLRRIQWDDIASFESLGPDPKDAA